MTMDQLINILAMITLLELMVTIGLGVTLADIAGVFRDWPVLWRAALANYILVPAAAVGLLLAFRASPMVAAGFLIAAVCPGAPYGPPLTAMARGSVALSVGLMVILAGSSAILAPLLLRILLPAVAGDQPLRVDAVRMISTLMLSQFLPLCVGLYVRHRNEALAIRLKKPAGRLSIVLNLLLVATILAVQFRSLAAIRPRGYLGMAALLGATVMAGWLLGGASSESRKAMTMATSVRNVGVSLVIASGSFPGTPAVTAATAYALVQTTLIALLALAWGCWTSHKVAAVPSSLQAPIAPP